MKYQSIIKPPKSQCLKSGRVTLQPGEEVGEHVTANKEELLVIIAGEATVVVEGKKNKIKAGKSFFIGAEKIHNVINNSQEKLEYYYVVALLN